MISCCGMASIRYENTTKLGSWSTHSVSANAPPKKIHQEKKKPKGIEPANSSAVFRLAMCSWEPLHDILYWVSTLYFRYERHECDTPNALPAIHNFIENWWLCTTATFCHHEANVVIRGASLVQREERLVCAAFCAACGVGKSPTVKAAFREYLAMLAGRWWMCI